MPVSSSAVMFVKVNVPANAEKGTKIMAARMGSIKICFFIMERVVNTRNVHKSNAFEQSEMVRPPPRQDAQRIISRRVSRMEFDSEAPESSPLEDRPGLCPNQNPKRKPGHPFGSFRVDHPRAAPEMAANPNPSTGPEKLRAKAMTAARSTSQDSSTNLDLPNF